LPRPRSNEFLTGFSRFAGLVAAPDARCAQIDFDLRVAVLCVGAIPGAGATALS